MKQICQYSNFILSISILLSCMACSPVPDKQSCAYDGLESDVGFVSTDVIVRQSELDDPILLSTVCPYTFRNVIFSDDTLEMLDRNVLRTNLSDEVVLVSYRANIFAYVFRKSNGEKGMFIKRLSPNLDSVEEHEF